MATIGELQNRMKKSWKKTFTQFSKSLDYPGFISGKGETDLKSKLKKGLIAGALALTLAMPATASTLDAAALDNYIENSVACVIGEVTAIEYEQRGPFMYTKSTVSVSDTAFGSTPSEITVLTLGGPIPNMAVPVAQVAAGVPTLRKGQELMFVLDATEQSGEYQISGLSAGAINIVNGTVALADGQGRISLNNAISTMQAIRAGETLETQ